MEDNEVDVGGLLRRPQFPVLYLAGVRTQQQAEHLAGHQILMSYAHHRSVKWLDRYLPLFSGLLLDSGAFSELQSGQQIDLAEYTDWAMRYTHTADAVAGLDDISGDWRRSLRNYETFDRGFPTIHTSDPLELLPDLVEIALARDGWLGLGICPEASAKTLVGGGERNDRRGWDTWVRWVCDNVPKEIHLHGWALTEYAYLRRFDSFDSTGWWRYAHKLNTRMPWLTYGECIEITAKRLMRLPRALDTTKNHQTDLALGPS